MSEDMKRCPFCGLLPMLYIGRVEFTDAEVECECGANVGNYPTEDEAIDAWNKRYDDSQARLSEAVKVLEKIASVSERNFGHQNEKLADIAPLARSFLTSLGKEDKQ